MREAELNRQRVVFPPQEAARLPQDRPYAAYICHYDWAEGEHATLMHCHERLAEVLLILKGSGRYTVDLRRYEVAAGDVVLCIGGASAVTGQERFFPLFVRIHDHLGSGRNVPHQPLVR